MRRFFAILLFATPALLSLLLGAQVPANPQTAPKAAAAPAAYLGFDTNDYPGDAALPALRRTFHLRAIG